KSDYPDACQIEAVVRIRNGDYALARAALLPIGETTLRTRFDLTKLYAQAMTETLWLLIDDEFNAVLEAQAKLKPKTSGPAIGFLWGVLEAAPTKERAEWVASHAARVLADDPNAPLVRQIRALALYRQAELAVTTNPKLGPPIWNDTLVAAA